MSSHLQVSHDSDALFSSELVHDQKVSVQYASIIQHLERIVEGHITQVIVGNTAPGAEIIPPN
ncbi:hypothetical protein [Serratia sp. UGAL515B_01]|uniref:hypothetical protein n=1 Tax=Serratia sp. UGAL515B_01 TaxID=2986763 RepID=UPI002954308C|nr:hypothetical protein [Serratia sp. UGAL515B_01]WON76155.1 hypothetical protein OK023_13020 [Serratia sp. UGAL515B_01]